jgi:hypothetical protein
MTQTQLEYRNRKHAIKYIYEKIVQTMGKKKCQKLEIFENDIFV